MLGALSRSSQRTKLNTGIVWFRNALRLHDQPMLTAAARRHARLILIAFDHPGDHAQTRFGHPRQGSAWHGFRAESVAALDCALRRWGQRLVWRRGDPVASIALLARQHGARSIWTTYEPGNAEQCALDQLAARIPPDCSLEVARDNRLFDEVPLVDADWPMSFSKFRRIVERNAVKVGESDPPRALPPPCDAMDGDALPRATRGRGLLVGGEARGLQRLEDYLFGRGRILTYKKTRDGLNRSDDSSRLSPWLAHGCLSARRAWREIERFEQTRQANDSTYWLKFELLWREYFRWLMDATGAALFTAKGLAENPPKLGRNPDMLDRWRAGRTGVPLVDAGMRELAATGYTSNRARQNVASFLVKDLGQDWRVGAAWFQHCLIDYDTASNWGNWAYQAGTGTDPRQRWFNVVSQARRYDPDGAFIARWIPELARLSPADRIAPWNATPVPADYPKPIVTDARWSGASSRDG